jgi:hypothetical protein
MTFFYDLNKKLADIGSKSETKQLTEGAVAEVSYSPKAARAGKDIGKPGKAFAQIAKSAGDRYGSKERGEKVAGAVLAKLRGKHESVEEGGTPMTPKQKSFAKLALPRDKITFADKIAGAKKEVDEMLGDVAAEAMKSALKGGQKKLDKNHNGRLDAQDFEMLRKGGKQETDEGIHDDDDDWYGLKSKTHKTSSGGTVTRHGGVTRHQAAPGHYGGYDPETDPDKDDDQPGKSTGEKRGRGRPKGTGKAIGAKGPSGKSKLLAKENAGQAQEIYNDLADIRAVAKQAQGSGKFPQGFASRLEAVLWAAMTLIKNQQPNTAQVREDDLEEKAVSKKQQKFMGMVHAAQKGEKPASKEVAKVAKTMKKSDAEDFAATKHKGLPEKVKSKKKKEESVEETTTSGSVATSDAPKGKSGVQFGKGIYDSFNRELEGMIAESMSVNISSDSEGGKSINVSATDEDAVKLAQMLQMAGMGGDHGHDEGACPGCGQSPCNCAEVVDENQPDWPTNTECSDDALQYSGGLNKPKTTVDGDGQTTVPVTAVQGGQRASTYEDNEITRMQEMAGITGEGVIPKELQGAKKVDVPAFLRKGQGGDWKTSKDDLEKDRDRNISDLQTMKKMSGRTMEENLFNEFSNFKL